MTTTDEITGEIYTPTVYAEPVDALALMQDDEDAPPVELANPQLAELATVQERSGLRFTLLEIWPGAVPIRDKRSPDDPDEVPCHWYLVQFDEPVPDFRGRRFTFFLTDTADRRRYADWYRKHVAEQPLSGLAVVKVSDGKFGHPYLRVEPRR